MTYEHFDHRIFYKTMANDVARKNQIIIAPIADPTLSKICLNRDAQGDFRNYFRIYKKMLIRKELCTEFHGQQCSRM